MVTAPQQDRRKSARHRVFKHAQISFHEHFAAIDCAIHDYSDTGLHLILESPVGVPDHFDLLQEGHPPRKCRVIWRHAHELGVEFV